MSFAPPQEPPQQSSGSVFDIKLRLFGIGLRITPSFWIWNAIWALIIFYYLAHQQLQNKAAIYIYVPIWLGVILVSTLAHELGHAIMARIFGQPTDIVLSREGGGTVGDYPDLATWKRMLVIAMGPLAGFSLVVLIVFFDPYTSGWNELVDELPEFKIHRWCIVDKIEPGLRIDKPPLYQLSLWLLLGINIFLNIFQLFPIIPTDGGMFFKEICCYISPSQGLKMAFGVSVLVGLALTIVFLLIVLHRWMPRQVPDLIPWPFIFPELSLISFGMMTYRCFGAYRELAVKERHSMYREYYDD